MGLVNAFTLEASFAGAAVGKHAKQHFNTGEPQLAVGCTGRWSAAFHSLWECYRR